MAQVTDRGAVFQPSIDALLDLIDSLPQRVSIVSTYRGVGHIAHGWFMRCVRGVRAVLLLQSNGFEGEASPLMRSVVEHQVALLWLLAEGPAILDPIKRVHGVEAAKLFREWRAAQKTDPGTDQLDEIMESVADATDSSLDYLAHFAHRARRWGTQTDRVVYHGEVMRSHATFQSASAYYDFRSRETLRASKEPEDHRHFAAVYLFRSASVFGQILLGEPWAEDLALIEEELRELTPEIAKALDGDG